MNDRQLQRIRTGNGFIAALDQSGGSTPKALERYGVGRDAFSNDEEMFSLMHEMRSRIITSRSFNGDRIIGAILFEDTMDRTIDGRDSVDYLWSVKGVVPFLKVDKGLAEESDGVQLMKPIPGLDDLLGRALAKGVFGTKMRSVVKLADDAGIESIVEQQFEIGRRILGRGLIPILEPEIDIESPEKAQAEAMLRDEVFASLDRLRPGEQLMFKLTLPEEDNFYLKLTEHPNVLRVVALSGGYSREEANRRLARNRGVVASFSRGLTEGLSADQSDEEFDAALDASIASIYEASIA
ncbi:MAG: fructose bisphosphate aldolase [Actinomycetota bacterium]